MWNMGDGWGWWMLFGWIWMIAFWGLIVWAVVALVSRTSGPRPQSEAKTNPLQILEERYARGDISHEEFEERRRRLLETGT